MKKIIISKKKFLENDQRIFGSFSGDTNLIHINHILARRTLHGACIVHGMNLLLWALEGIASKLNSVPSEINSKFNRPVFLNQNVICTYDKKLKMILISQNEEICVSVAVKFQKIKIRNKNIKHLPSRKNSLNSKFNNLTLEKEFKFNLRGKPDLATKIFPNLLRLYGDLFVNEIAGLSQIVGMECPGLHSLFTTLKLAINSNDDVPFYKIVRKDERIKLISIDVFANSFKANIGCLFRPKPVKAITYKKAKKLIVNDEFKNVKALIVGGSRGLGECVAKLISAGGGKSIISYQYGKDDAKLIKNEISSSGGSCSITHIDINKSKTFETLFSNTTVNQIYYFASPKISAENQNNCKFNRKIYENIFVEKFSEFINHCSRKSSNLIIFYPSTEFIDNPPNGFSSYVKTKLAGEQLCKDLTNKNKNLKIIFSRLPTLNTDQNQSLFNIWFDINHNSNILLPIIRKMCKSFDHYGHKL